MSHRTAVLEPVCRTPTRRRAVSGALGGIVAGDVLTVALGPVGLGVGILAGISYGLLFQPIRRATTAALVGAAAGISLWLTVAIAVVPLASGRAPNWTPAGLRAALPALGLWLVAGSVLATTSAGTHRVLAWAAPARGQATGVDGDVTDVVVLGGGFAGLYAARRLEALFGPDESVRLTMVSRDNATLFTPMLPEVAGGSLAPTEVTTPLRTALDRTRVFEAAATGVDLSEQEVTLDVAVGPRDSTAAGGRTAAPEASDGPISIPYDHLILALGSVPDDKGTDPAREFLLDFKSLGDAMRIRNHVIGCFERANATDDPEERQRLTRLVIVGGGFAGAELAGALNDLAHSLVPYYPSVERSSVEVTVVHSRQRILPELNDELAEYALDRMRDRGIRFELGARVADATPGAVTLTDGRTIEAGAAVWTAGNSPHPLIETLDLPQEGPGAVAVDQTLAVPDSEGVWAVGDCAAVRDPETGEPYPNTAQYATRAGAVVAENVHSTVRGEDPTPFTHESQGVLAVIGHQVAVADIIGWRFSGRFAWLLWRAIYLFKIPGLAQTVRVTLRWATELFFPRDIVRTIDTGPQATTSGGRPDDRDVTTDAPTDQAPDGGAGDADDRPGTDTRGRGEPS